MELHDRAAFANAGEDRFRAELGREHHGRGVADRARESARPLPAFVVVAAADRREVPPTRAEVVPERDRFRREHRAGRLPTAGGDLDRVHSFAWQRLVPRAADAHRAEVKLRVVDREERTLLVNLLHRSVDRNAGLTYLVVDPRRRAEGVAVPVVGREFDAGHQEQLWMSRLRMHEVVVLGDRVVVRNLHDIESAPLGKRRERVEVGFRVRALSRVHVKICGVPARFGGERQRRHIGRALGLGRKGRRRAERHLDAVLAGKVEQLRFAHDDLPGPRDDRTWDVSA